MSLWKNILLQKIFPSWMSHQSGLGGWASRVRSSWRLKGIFLLFVFHPSSRTARCRPGSQNKFLTDCWCHQGPYLGGLQSTPSTPPSLSLSLDIISYTENISDKIFLNQDYISWNIWHKILLSRKFILIFIHKYRWSNFSKAVLAISVGCTWLVLY